MIIIQYLVIITEVSKALFCSSKFLWARETVSSKCINNLCKLPQKFAIPGLYSVKHRSPEFWTEGSAIIKCSVICHSRLHINIRSTMQRNVNQYNDNKRTKVQLFHVLKTDLFKIKGLTVINRGCSLNFPLGS